jgi:uroporphyrinogen-III synthase
LKILVTRPRDQAQQLARDIELAGGIPLLCPLLEIAPAPDTQALHELMSRLDQYDLAIFISPNAVRYGMKAIRGALSPNPSPVHGGGERDSAGEGGISILPPALKMATVGPGSAKALHESGVNDVIVPVDRFDSEGLLAQLPNVAGWRVMIFRGDGGRELLGDTLKARGAVVEYASCYSRRKPQLDVSELLKADAITVTSSEALSHLSDIVQNSLSGIPLFVPHPRIAELARVQGWQHIHLTQTGDDGLLSALREWGRSRIED